jgi:RNA:NAD 2'-phosphotransferase (TPT1/KptA family)
MRFKVKILDKKEYLYHATYGVFLDSIMKQGLIRGYRKNWEFSQNYIYLTNDPDIAESFAETAEEVPEEYLDDIIVLKIDKSKLNPDYLELDENITQGEDNEEDDSIYSFQYRGNISPELIKVIKVS